MADTTRPNAAAAPVQKARPGAVRWAIAVVLLILAGWAGWHTYRVFQQRSVVDHIDELGGVVTYDFEDTDPDYRDKRTEGPSFIANLLGNDYSHDIVDVNLRTSDRTSLSDEDLKRVSELPMVRNLAVANGSEITDEGLQVLAGMTHLEKLTLANLPNVTDAGLAVLANLPNLRKLELSTLPKITDKGLQGLAEMKNLRDLIVTRCPINGSSWQHLQPANLELIEFTSCEINDASLKHLSGAVGLEELSASNNAIRGEGLAHLKGLSKLLRLRLADNKELSPALAMVHLKELANLELINLRGTQFDRKAGEELAKALPKCDITIDGGNYDPEEGQWYFEDERKE